MICLGVCVFLVPTKYEEMNACETDQCQVTPLKKFCTTSSLKNPFIPCFVHRDRNKCFLLKLSDYCGIRAI